MSKVKVNISEKEKRRKLIDFIDDKVFNPVLNAKGDEYSKETQKMLEEVQEKTRNEMKKFHNNYHSAKEVKEEYLSNTYSQAAKKVNKILKELKLPTLPEYKDEFNKLCNELDI